jgi:enoyl-CoA hydratase/carnithine racemase
VANQFVNYTIEENVAVVTISNDRTNMLSTPVMDELERTIDALNASPDAKVIILTGAGMGFVAGADIREIAGLTTAEKGRQATARGQAILNKIENGPKPVIAAINGRFCLGGGLELALACHIRIAGDRCELGLPEIKLGIMPGFGGTQRLPRVVGAAKALELILTGDSVKAPEAKAIGLVNQVVPDADLMKQARAVARAIAARGQLAVRGALDVARAAAGRPLAEGLKAESERFGALCETEDMKEGIRAFLEKRQARFQDR